MKRFQKILAVMLSVMLVVCMIPAMSVSAADGDIEISTVEQLKAFRDSVNSGNTYSDKTVTLTADLDLNNEEWTPIGYMGKTFLGTFDGGHNTISNLKITKELSNKAENNGVGLFGRTDAPAVIKNLTIVNAAVKGSLFVGAIVGRAYTGNAVENCTVKGDIKIDAYWYAGVIGGNGYMGRVENCHVIGNDGSYIKGNDGSYIGGIWGFRGEGANKTTNCTVTNLDITGVDRVGGISGIAHYGNTVSDCTVKNVSITATDPEATTVGLIVGANQGGKGGNAPSTFKDNSITNTSATAGGKAVYNWTGTTIDGDQASINADSGCYDHSKIINQFVPVPAKEATFSAAGHIAYYTCPNNCGARFSVDGSPLTEEEVTIPALVPPAQTIIIIPRMDNFMTSTGEFNDEAYYCRAARAGDVVLLKVSASDLGDQFNLDYRKITVKYEVEGATQLGESFDYNGDPVYKDGIATRFMLGSGLNNIVAHVYYNDVYCGAFDPFYAYIN